MIEKKKRKRHPERNDWHIKIFSKQVLKMSPDGDVITQERLTYKINLDIFAYLKHVVTLLDKKY